MSNKCYSYEQESESTKMIWKAYIESKERYIALLKFVCKSADYDYNQKLINEMFDVLTDFKHNSEALLKFVQDGRIKINFNSEAYNLKSSLL